MAGRKATGSRVIAFAQTPSVDDPKTQRALDVLTSAVQELQSKSIGPVVVTGSRSGGDALADLLEKLAGLGVIVDETTA